MCGTNGWVDIEPVETRNIEDPNDACIYIVQKKQEFLVYTCNENTGCASTIDTAK